MRKENHIFLLTLKLLVFALFLACWYASFDIQSSLTYSQRISLLALSEENLNGEVRKSYEASDSSKSDDISQADDQANNKNIDSGAELEAGNDNKMGSMPIEHSIDSADELISPIVSMCLTELTNIYDILELEYNSISSISMLDNLEECINTKNKIDEILEIMVRAKELLLHVGSDNFSDENLLQENQKKETNNKKGKTSDLFFYLQTNISILKRTISLYNIKYKVFSSQEQILSRISKLMSEINTLAGRFKNLTKNNKTAFEKVMFEITKPISKIMNEYKSILRKTNVFMYVKYYTKHSKNIEHYIQTISCMLKYRLQRSPMFEELLFMLKPTLNTCK
ncbi:signal peptide-containing protein [Cryptosporidium canis]|uniref:Signal peptide-containing protein n=1 Tax=Cryptosporidium canis TaxID=195482 RepID=A0ABQ8PCU4_9CRYT|nr:signal peptide-containing protein [Cryptosporidium canis]KAJ1614162.1 signal peptide-containing protein [Cryptosporidium canis]